MINLIKSYIKVIAAMLIWGTIALFVRNIPYRSPEIVMCRIIFGLLFLLVVWTVSGKKVDKAALKKNAPRLLLSGIVMGFNWAALFEAYIYVDVSIATLGYYCAPVFVVIGSLIFFRQKPGMVKTLAMAGAVVGMIIVTGVNMGGADPYRGLLLSLSAAVLYALVTLINKTVSGLGGLEITIMQLISAGIVMIPYALLTHTGPWAVPDAKAIISVLVLGFIHTGFALFLYFSSIQELPAQSVALCSYLDPVSALVFAAVLLGERMTMVQIVGAVLIIGSALCGELLSAKKAISDKSNAHK